MMNYLYFGRTYSHGQRPKLSGANCCTNTEQKHGPHPTEAAGSEVHSLVVLMERQKEQIHWPDSVGLIQNMIQTKLKDPSLQKY